MLNFIAEKIFLSIVLLTFLISCNEPKKVTELVSSDSVWNHLQQFDSIAKANNSNRAVGTPGGIASRTYIANTVETLGLTPVVQAFENRSGAQGCNLIVDIKGKSDQEIIMIGSHYDSVIFGPGINDNASGVAILLEIMTAIQKNKIVPDKTLRFAFWDSEETGVEGSPFYYNSLSNTEKAQITAYINIDMVASKDGEIQISDTDGSTIEAQLKELTKNGIEAESLEMLKEFYESLKFAKGSEQLEQILKEEFAKIGVTVVEDLTFAMNSDTAPFLKDIPTIGISAIKTSSEATEDGGEIISFAPCYHQACDDISNIDKGILESCLKACSAVIQRLAISEN